MTGHFSQCSDRYREYWLDSTLERYRRQVLTISFGKFCKERELQQDKDLQNFKESIPKSPNNHLIELLTGARGVIQAEPYAPIIREELRKRYILAFIAQHDCGEESTWDEDFKVLFDIQYPEVRL